MRQVEHDIPSYLLRSRAQKNMVVTAHNPAQAVHNGDFLEGFDSYRQHTFNLLKFAAGVGSIVTNKKRTSISS